MGFNTNIRISKRGIHDTSIIQHSNTNSFTYLLKIYKSKCKIVSLLYMKALGRLELN